MMNFNYILRRVGKPPAAVSVAALVYAHYARCLWRLRGVAAKEFYYEEQNLIGNTLIFSFTTINTNMIGK
jgi:hypothetical protein